MFSSGSKVNHKDDYSKLSFLDKPDHLILHVGTNDLVSGKSVKCIAGMIVKKAPSLRNNNQNTTSPKL